MTTKRLWCASTTRRGIEQGVDRNDFLLDSSQGGSFSDSFKAVEFESLFPQTISAAIATAALFIANHTVGHSQHASMKAETRAIQDELESNE